MVKSRLSDYATRKGKGMNEYFKAGKKAYGVTNEGAYTLGKYSTQGKGEIKPSAFDLVEYFGSISVSKGGNIDTKKNKELVKMAKILNKEAPKGHMLAYITPEEAQLLKAMGGSGEKTKSGIPAFPDYGGGGHHGMGGDTSGMGGQNGGNNDGGYSSPGNPHGDDDSSSTNNNNNNNNNNQNTFNDLSTYSPTYSPPEDKSLFSKTDDGWGINDQGLGYADSEKGFTFGVTGSLNSVSAGLTQSFGQFKKGGLLDTKRFKKA